MAISQTEFQSQQYFLAPMAGFSHLPFRRLCHKGQCDFNTTELVSARGIVYNGLAPSWRYLKIDPATEGPVAIQLFGAEVDDFLYACEKIMSDPVLSKCAAIDINMGCPVKKVCQTGAGSALMLTPTKAANIIRELKRYLSFSSVFVTAKFRKGFYAEDNTAVNFALTLAEAGVDRLCLHARTAKQMYSGHADWSLFAEVKTALCKNGFNHIPFIANGDIKSQADCLQIKEMADVDGFMIGRAACGNPWIFQTMKTAKDTVTAMQRVTALKECLLEMCEFFGEYTACHEFRSLIMPWLKGRNNSSVLRQTCGQIATLNDWLTFLDKLIDFFAADVVNN